MIIARSAANHRAIAEEIAFIGKMFVIERLHIIRKIQETIKMDAPRMTRGQWQLKQVCSFLACHSEEKNQTGYL